MSELETSSFNPRVLRRIVVGSGVFALFFSLYLLAFLLPDTVRSAAGAESMTVARAADVADGDSQYVTLTDGVWHCDTIKYLRGPSSSNRQRIVVRNTEIFYTDSASLPQVVVLVTESGEWTCEDFQSSDLDGYLTRMSSGTQQDLANENRLARFPGATDYLDLCAYCGPENSAIGVGFGTVFALAGIGLLVWGLRMRVDGDQ